MVLQLSLNLINYLQRKNPILSKMHKEINKYIMKINLKKTPLSVTVLYYISFKIKMLTPFWHLMTKISTLLAFSMISLLSIYCFPNTKCKNSKRWKTKSRVHHPILHKYLNCKTSSQLNPWFHLCRCSHVCKCHHHSETIICKIDNHMVVSNNIQEAEDKEIKDSIKVRIENTIMHHIPIKENLMVNKINRTHKLSKWIKDLYLKETCKAAIFNNQINNNNYNQTLNKVSKLTKVNLHQDKDKFLNNHRRSHNSISRLHMI